MSDPQICCFGYVVRRKDRSSDTANAALARASAFHNDRRCGAMVFTSYRSHYDTWLGLFQRVKQITVAPLELMEIVRLIECSECLLLITMSE